MPRRSPLVCPNEAEQYAGTGTQVGSVDDEVVSGEVVVELPSGAEWEEVYDGPGMTHIFTLRVTDEFIARGEGMVGRALNYHIDEIKSLCAGRKP